MTTKMATARSFQRTNKQMNERTNKRKNEKTNKPTNEQTNKRTNEQTNKRTNKQTNSHPRSSGVRGGAMSNLADAFLADLDELDDDNAAAEKAADSDEDMEEDKVIPVRLKHRHG